MFGAMLAIGGGIGAFIRWRPRSFSIVSGRWVANEAAFKETWYQRDWHGMPHMVGEAYFYSIGQMAWEHFPSRGELRAWLPDGKPTTVEQAKLMLKLDNGDGTFSELES
jgi:hypothetical protein